LPIFIVVVEFEKKKKLFGTQLLNPKMYYDISGLLERERVLNRLVVDEKEKCYH